MNVFCLTFIVVIGTCLAEPPVPSGYGYRRPSAPHYSAPPTGSYLPPSSSSSHGSISYVQSAPAVHISAPSGSYGLPSTGPSINFHASGSSSAGYSHSSAGAASTGGYQAVSSGYQTNEGEYVDPQLLHKIEEILVEHENSNTNAIGGAGSSHGHYDAPSSAYGPPSTAYGPPGYHQQNGGGRVVGVQLSQPNSAIQVAQYQQTSYAPSHSYPSVPSQSYGAPSHSYAAPSVQYAAPSVSYSAPSVSYSAPSASYGAPAIQVISAPSSHSHSHSSSASHSASASFVLPGPISLPALSIPSKSYGPPSVSYLPPSTPSGSYGPPGHH